MTDNATNVTTTTRIQAALDKITAEHNAEILFAVESGSRAWGFASPDSDYDVRFVYKRTLRDYVRVFERRDVIELPIAGGDDENVDILDINGWDILKALGQFRKSNPTLLEWLYSPIIYRSEGEFALKLRSLAKTHYSPRRMTYHYLSMAKQNYRLSIENKPEVSLKKYLYVLRPLVCVAWLEQNASPPPTSIHETLANIEMPVPVRMRLMELMERKRNIGELGTEPHDLLLDRFIDSELARVAAAVVTLPDVEIETCLIDAILWAEMEI